MKTKTIFSSNEVYKMDDGNTTAIWVGVSIGTIKPVSIEALFRDDAKATEFQNTLAAYEDIDEIVDAIYKHSIKSGAEQVVVSAADDAIVLKR